jgi:hypothetical protein
MRRRNRKKQLHGFVFPVRITGFLVVVSTLALIYIWLGCRCEALGKEIKVLEQEKGVLYKRYLNEEYRWTQLKAPRNIEKALAKFNIPMIWPASHQVVRLQDSDGSRRANSRLEVATASPMDAGVQRQTASRSRSRP